MAAQDQIEIINSQGDIRFHPLSGGGITNIGRHPDNDIIIDSPVVAPFHAILDHQNKPYRLVALTAANPIKVSGQVLQPNSPYVLHNWDTIELDGHSLVLMEGSGGSAPMLAPTLTPAPPPTPIPPIAPPAGGAAPQTPAGDPFSHLPDLEEPERLLAAPAENRSD